MQELALIAGSIVLSLLTHYGKKHWAGHPLFIVVALSLVSGVGYAALTKTGLMDTVKEWSTLVATGSVFTYNLFKPIYEKVTGNELGKSLHSENLLADKPANEVAAEQPADTPENDS